MRERRGKEGWIEGGEREGGMAERERDYPESRGHLKFMVVQEWVQLKHCLAR